MGLESVAHMKSVVLERLKNDVGENWKIGIDEAWANRARRQSKVAYGLVYEPYLDAFIDYNVTSMNCMKCSLEIPHSDCKKSHDRTKVSSETLGWECTKVLVEKPLNW